MAHSHDSHSGSHSTYHGTVKGYLTGFVLSIILTAIPFWMVMEGDFSTSVKFWTISILAVVQIIVHLKYFLHLDFTHEGKPNTLAFLFSALIIVLVVGLSLWIIYESNAMMM